MKKPPNFRIAECCFNCKHRETSIIPCEKCLAMLEEYECILFDRKLLNNEPEMVCDKWSEEK